MKIVAVVGSPHGMRKATGTIVKSLLEGAASSGAEVEIVSLAEPSLRPCTGCRRCGAAGRCVVHDEFNRINSALIEADGIVLASPNYFHNVSAQIKAVIDHGSVLCHCQILKNKYGAVAVSSGGPAFEAAEQYLLHVLEMFGCWSVGSVCSTTPQMQDEDERARLLGEAAGLGKRLAAAITAKAVFPEQEPGLLRSFEAMRMMVELYQDAWTFEYDYWKAHHGL